MGYGSRFWLCPLEKQGGEDMRFWITTCTIAVCTHFGSQLSSEISIGLIVVASLGLVFDFVELMKGE